MNTERVKSAVAFCGPGRLHAKLCFELGQLQCNLKDRKGRDGGQIGHLVLNQPEARFTIPSQPLNPFSQQTPGSHGLCLESLTLPTLLMVLIALSVAASDEI